MAFPGGRATHPEQQIEEENEEKMEGNNRKMGQNEEMFLSCPPEVESLATPLQAPQRNAIIVRADLSHKNITLDSPIKTTVCFFKD